ncbi:MAG: hypothetical protein OXG59_09865 [Gammaproteobacteria bacterium]|nr:hypothetical protein [Gammaproteobacteria bacterium]
MSEVTFDTHAEIRKLERAGCPKTQAEAMVDLVSRAPLNIQMVKALERLSFQVETNMATKADIAELRAETKADIADLRAETRSGIADLRAETRSGIADVRTETKADFARLEGQIATSRKERKADIEELRADIFRALWIQGASLAALILAFAAVALR